MIKLLIFLTLITQTFANTLTIEPFEAEFIQTVTNTSGKSIKYKGKIYLDNNDNILWKYLTPTTKNIYINKNNLVIEEPELEQAIITNIQDMLNLNQLLEKAIHIENNIYEAIAYDTKYKIMLNGKNIRQIQYNDPLDNTIVINFFSLKNKDSFQAGLFNFVAKDYYDIIRK